VRNKRVRVKIRSSEPNLPPREFDFRISPQSVAYRELGKRDSDRTLPWNRIVGTAMIHKDPEEIVDATDIRTLEILLDACDRYLPKRRFMIALLRRGIGVRRSNESASTWRIIPWRSLLSLGLRGKW
jgi:hypothetical protein